MINHRKAVSIIFSAGLLIALLLGPQSTDSKEGPVVKFEDYSRTVGYGQTGRVKLTTLTKEFFVPGFMERDEGEREMPYEKYPWDGVSGVRPFHEFAQATTVGVY